MGRIRVTPLGAGRDVGRSCVLVEIGDKLVMFDCGLHMGYYDDRKFPDFGKVSPNRSVDSALTCVVITHFHLDHCGALPYFTEVFGYNGPIYMTHPTKAICPLLLEDYAKISERRDRDERGAAARRAPRSGGPNYRVDHIRSCMRRVTGVSLRQTVRVDKDTTLTAYFAGHVLGAAMFLLRVGSQSVLYTGDYNMTPDRHLGGASVDRCKPDLLITESTYGSVTRDSKRSRERDFLRKVHDCLVDGGKVLLPVFAIGRAQELMMLLEQYWEKMDLTYPIYYSSRITSKSNTYYKLYMNWTNQRIKDSFTDGNPFEFKHIKVFDQKLVTSPEPMVVLASPGMLHSGMSLEIFRAWCEDPKNMVIMPGYCVANTWGAKVLAGIKEIPLDESVSGRKARINMRVKHLSFSAHADAKGILQLIRHCEPSAVMLVHGEPSRMNVLQDRIEKGYALTCFAPSNNETVTLMTPETLPFQVSRQVMNDALEAHFDGVLEKVMLQSDFPPAKDGSELSDATMPLWEARDSPDGEQLSVAPRGSRILDMEWSSSRPLPLQAPSRRPRNASIKVDGILAVPVSALPTLTSSQGALSNSTSAAAKPGSAKYMLELLRGGEKIAAAPIKQEVRLSANNGGIASGPVASADTAVRLMTRHEMNNHLETRGQKRHTVMFSLTQEFPLRALITDCDALPQPEIAKTLEYSLLQVAERIAPSHWKVSKDEQGLPTLRNGTFKGRIRTPYQQSKGKKDNRDAESPRISMELEWDYTSEDVGAAFQRELSRLGKE